MAAGATYEPIATQTLASAASSITFSSIAASWTDLRLVIVGSTSAQSNVFMRLNSDTASNYSYTALWGSGTAAGSQKATASTFMSFAIYNGFEITTPMLRTADFFSYAGSTYKTVLTTESSDLNGSTGSVLNAVQLWRSTAAITTILIYATGGNFNSGTTAALYGIKAA
jgi:hypothetical protein